MYQTTSKVVNERANFIFESKTKSFVSINQKS